MDSILILLIGLNLIVSFKGFNDLLFFRKYEFHIGSIRSGDQFRMISSGFLHADLGHLFFNMFTLFMFAPVVIGYLGDFSFVLVYATSLVFGSLLTLYFHKNDYNYRAIGASGAVTGITNHSAKAEGNIIDTDDGIMPNRTSNSPIHSL